MTAVGNWVLEQTNTVGTGIITLAGATPTFASFANSIPAGTVWYSIQDTNGNREAGIGTFDGDAILVRTTVQATLIGTTYNDVNPTAISLSGDATVACTFSAESYKDLLDQISNIATSADLVSYDPTGDTVSVAVNVQNALIEHANAITAVDSRVDAISIDGGYELVEEYFDFADFDLTVPHTVVTTATAALIPSVNNLDVYVSGVIQRFGVDFDLPANNSIRILNKTLGVADYILMKAAVPSLVDTTLRTELLAEGGADRIGKVGGGTVQDFIDASDTTLRTDLAASGGSDLVGYGETTLTESLGVNVKQFGAVGDGVKDDTTAFEDAMASLGAQGGAIYIPPGDYVISRPQIIADVANGGIFNNQASLIFYGDGSTCSRIVWVGDDGYGRTGTAFKYLQKVYGGFYDIGFITRANRGHTSQVIQVFTTTTTTLAGCDSTSSKAIVNENTNGPFVVEGCDIEGFHIAVDFGLGSNRAVINSRITWCNVGVYNRSAATASYYSNTSIERCAIGVQFRLTSAHLMNNCVIQANYAGCDVNVTQYTHSIHFKNCYFEASPQVVVISGGGDGDVTITPSGIRFEECNSLAIYTTGRVNDIHLIRNQCEDVPIEHVGSEPGTYILSWNTQHVDDGLGGRLRRPAEGFILGSNAEIINHDENGLSDRRRIETKTAQTDGVNFSAPALLLSNKSTVNLTGYTSIGLAVSTSPNVGISLSAERSSADGQASFVVKKHLSSATGTEYFRIDISGNSLPGSDSTLNFGSTVKRWNNGYINKLRPGAGTATWTSGTGTPEGNVIGVVGSLYTRTDGGTGTTLYVKESGSSSTGWVAK